jgi:hypothetical protein
MTNYLRKNAWDDNNGGQFTNSDGSYTNLYWYAKAVGVMKAKPISDPTSWWFYAAIHGQYLTDYFGSGSAPTNYPNWTKIDSIPSVANLGSLPSQNQINLFWNQCQHGTWFFAPWHRGYLTALEHILRDIIVNLGGPSDWALPYWNYLNQSKKYSENKIPPAFASNKPLPDGTPNPLYVPERYGPQGDSNVYLVVGPGLQNEINDECQWDTIYSSPTDPQNDPITAPDQAGSNIYGNHWGGAQTGFSHSNGGFGDLENNPHNFTHSIVGGLKSQSFTNLGTPFPVQSTLPWQNTGINIKQGSTVLVSFTSCSWTADPGDNNGNLYDANGSPDIIVSPTQPLYPMVNVPMGALVGRVNGGTPFLIGDGSVVPDDVSGLLELCINDDLTGAYGAGLKDNRGAINVSLTSTPSEEYEGLMADPGLAALDPIFFLHHANIDRMWAAWNVTGKNQNPTDANWLAGPSSNGNSRFAMPMDTAGTPWYYSPSDVVNTLHLKYYGGVNYSYTYDDLSLTSYSNTPPVSQSLGKRLMKLGVTKKLESITMSAKNKNELVGASGNAIVLSSGTTQTAVKLDGTGWKSVTNSLAKASITSQPDEVFLVLENVTGTNNSNILMVYVNNQFVKSVSLFGIRMASMKNSEHGGSGLTFKFNITSIVDDLHLNNNINLESLDVQIRTKNPFSKGSVVTVGRISVYRIGQ